MTPTSLIDMINQIINLVQISRFNLEIIIDNCSVILKLCYFMITENLK